MQMPLSDLKLVIFDIDDTLHNATELYMDKHVVDILQQFKDNNIPMAIASLNIMGDLLLEQYGILHFFDCIELRKDITNCKTHFEIWDALTLEKGAMLKRILERFTVNAENALFFDDAYSHINEASALGINAVQVDKERRLQWSDIVKGLHMFR